MNFKSLREDKLKLTQEQFAEVYGLELSVVQELEKNNEPGLTLIQEIIKKTGLSFEEICFHINTCTVFKENRTHFIMRHFYFFNQCYPQVFVPGIN